MHQYLAWAVFTSDDADAACWNGRTGEACALSFQWLMRGLLSFEKRWYVLTSCDWNKGCSRSWKERRLELKLYIFDQFCAWLTKFRKSYSKIYRHLLLDFACIFRQWNWWQEDPHSNLVKVFLEYVVNELNLLWLHHMSHWMYIPKTFRSQTGLWILPSN